MLASYDDAVRQLIKSSFLSDVVIHFTSGQLHRLVMELSEERAELQEMRDMLQDNFDKIEDKLNALLLADLKAALYHLKYAISTPAVQDHHFQAALDHAIRAFGTVQQPQQRV